MIDSPREGAVAGKTFERSSRVIKNTLEALMFRLSWKWRERSAVKITGENA